MLISKFLFTHISLSVIMAVSRPAIRAAVLCSNKALGEIKLGTRYALVIFNCQCVEKVGEGEGERKKGERQTDLEQCVYYTFLSSPRLEGGSAVVATPAPLWRSAPGYPMPKASPAACNVDGWARSLTVSKPRHNMKGTHLYDASNLLSSSLRFKQNVLSHCNSSQVATFQM